MVDKKRFLVAFFLGIFLISFASASFIPGKPNRSLETIYGPSSSITGWINISFTSEPLNSIFDYSFNSSRGNSANLSGILNNNLGYFYSCAPVDCNDDYTASDGEQTKTTTLNSGDSKIYGVRLSGKISTINSFEFFLDSGAAASCTNQIGIDFLDDSVLDARNNNSLYSESCNNLKDYGCFDSGETQEEFTIGSTPYCERVNFSSSPGFLIGAWIKKISGSGKIKASIYDVEGGGEITKCTLPDASSSGGEVSCSINYSVSEPKEYYVCIYNSTGGSGEYRIKGYSTNEGCGFYGTPPTSEMTADYQIFAQGKKFGAVGALKINQSVSPDNYGRSLAELADEYIRERYGSLDCSSGCVIPININSNLNQEITLRDLKVNYEKSSGMSTESNFYEISKTPAKITSDFQKLYLDGSGFFVPNLGNYTFSLKLDGQNIFSEKIQVKEVPIIKSVTPTRAASAYSTEFTASVTSKNNLSNFSWDFGDDTSEVTTLGNKTSHTYSSIGVYKLRVRVTDQKQLSSSKVFEINVSSPREMINSSLYDMEKDLSNLEKEISTFSQFYQEALNSSLNLNYTRQKVTDLRTAYQSATSEEEYNAIVGELSGLKIPEGITKSRSGQDLSLFFNGSDVDLYVLQKIGGGNYSTSKEEDYQNAVLLWNQDNLDVDFDFNEFSGRYPGYTEPVTRIFEVYPSEKKSISYDYYLIIPELEGFKTDSEFEVESGYIYFNLKGKDSVSFSSTEDIDFTNLPVFISPPISKLDVTIMPPEKEEKSNWTIFLIVIFSLLILGVIGYLIMRAWYRRKYENYLFKNRNDLYNMVHYVNNAKRKGLTNKEIEENLKKAGWSSERIKYVMKKYAGKSGLMGIPVTKLAQRPGGTRRI